MSWPNKQLKEEIMKYKNVHISVESNDKKPGLVNKLYQLISMKKIEITSRKEFLERREMGFPQVLDKEKRSTLSF